VRNGAAPQPPGTPEIAVVRLVPSTNIVYLGEVISVEIQCYCQDNVGNIQMPQLSGDSFIVGNIPEYRQHPPHVRVGNTVYNLFSFHIPATATKTGRLTLGPATWNLSIYDGQRTVFGWMGGSHPANFVSDAPTIEVRPLPTEGQPPTFTGAVGDFGLAQYEAAPTAVGVGDPVTLKIRIAGHGAFDTVKLGTNNEPGWREFKIYPPSSKFDSSDPMQIEGSKYFEQVVTPENAEVKEIPPFVFSFFDPSRNMYRTLSHTAIPLSVHPTAATPQPTILSTGAPPPDAQPQGEEIVHIKPMLGRTQAQGLPLIERPEFWEWQAAAPILWIGALLRRKQKERLANNPRLRRQRQVARVVQEGLNDLSRQAAANDADKFYATVLRLLQEQLGERLDLPAPAITEAVLEDVKNLRPETQTLLRELFHACNQYRYTPEHTSQEMNSLIPKVKTALHDLQAMPASKSPRAFAQGVGLALLLLSAATLRAQTPVDAFVQANKLYEEGKYPQAAAAYEKLTDSGIHSPALYFNLGNACLKSGKLGQAIYAYRQAQNLAPRDPDIRANLQIARSQAGNNAVLPGSRWTRWAGHLTLNEWTGAASVAVALFFLVLAAREIVPSLRQSSGGWLTCLGVISVGLVIGLTLAVEQHLIDRTSVVITPEAVVRRGPLNEAQSAFTVHDGAELRVLGQDGDWLQVSDASRHIGWVAQRDVRGN
jgi:tetratricopeptide (TPR) repeat protein